MATVTESKQTLSRIFESMSFGNILRVRTAYVEALIACDEIHNEVATGIMTELLNYVDAYLSKLAILIDEGWEGLE